MPFAEKEFVLKHVIKDVSNMEEREENQLKIEEQFGIPWAISVIRNKDHLGLGLYCLKKKTGKKWSIEVSLNLKISSVNGKHFSKSCEAIIRSTEKTKGWAWPHFMKWDALMKEYVIDDTLKAEIHVKIKKMTGIEQKKILRNFDESNKKFSDVALVVEDQKFYISKLFLAGQSPYFNALLLENPEESKKEEVTLTGIKATDFQNYLEVLHLAPAIDDDTVTGIVHVANMYDTDTVISKCEKFLMKKSEKPLKKKLKLAAKYKLEKLKTECLLKIKTIDDIRSVLPGDMTRMNHSLLVALLQKAVSQPN